MMKTAKKPLLALDSSIAVHLMNDRPTAGQEPGWNDAQDILTLSDAYDLCLPAPVLTEVLGIVHDDDRMAAVKRLTAIFAIQHFDRTASELAAKHLWELMRQFGAHGLGDLAARLQCARQRLKVDLMIFATSVRWNSKLVVADQDFDKWKSKAADGHEIMSARTVLANRQRNLAFLADRRRSTL